MMHVYIATEPAPLHFWSINAHKSRNHVSNARDAESDECAAVQEMPIARPWTRRIATLVLAPAVVLVCGIAVWYWNEPAGIVLPAGVTSSDYERVAHKLRRSSSSVDRDAILFQLGVEQAARRKWDAAASLFALVSPLDPDRGREARYLQAQSVLQQDRLRDSERLFREYLAESPDAEKRLWPSQPNREERVQALHYLSYLLAVELRFEERKDLLGELVRRGEADLFDTLALHFQSLMEWNNTHGVQRLENACAIVPDDWRMEAVLAQYRIAQGRLDDAWTLLQTCHKQLPNDLKITAACMTCLEERSDDEGYERWGGELPPMRETDPVDLLRHRGQIAMRQQRFSEAATCFQRALAIDPAHVACRLGLAQAWLALEHPDRRKQDLATAQDLVRIQNRLGWATSKTPAPDVLLEIAQLSADAGLRTAAADVCRISILLVEDRTAFEKLLRHVTIENTGGESP